MSPRKAWLCGSYFITYSGIDIDPLNPRPEQIKLIDIAHALSNVCRFGGQCPTFYSVGCHSMYVADLLPPGLRAEGLLHDASEAYCGDMIKSLKVLCPDYQAIEDRFEAAIRERFCLGPIDPHVKLQVKRADIAALLAERRDIFHDRNEYDEIATAGEQGCVALHPHDAKVAFLKYAQDLGIE